MIIYYDNADTRFLRSHNLRVSIMLLNLEVHSVIVLTSLGASLAWGC